MPCLCRQTRGEKANYLTWGRDLAEGKYKLPWDDKIKIRDGWKYYPNVE